MPITICLSVLVIASLSADRTSSVIPNRGHIRSRSGPTGDIKSRAGPTGNIEQIGAVFANFITLTKDGPLRSNVYRLRSNMQYMSPVPRLLCLTMGIFSIFIPSLVCKSLSTVPSLHHHTSNNRGRRHNGRKNFCPGSKEPKTMTNMLMIWHLIAWKGCAPYSNLMSLLMTRGTLAVECEPGHECCMLWSCKDMFQRAWPSTTFGPGRCTPTSMSPAATRQGRKQSSNLLENALHHGGWAERRVSSLQGTHTLGGAHP